METSASFEARSAPSPYPTEGISRYLPEEGRRCPPELNVNNRSLAAIEEDTDGEMYHARGILPSDRSDRGAFCGGAVGDGGGDGERGRGCLGADARRGVVAPGAGRGADRARR